MDVTSFVQWIFVEFFLLSRDYASAYNICSAYMGSINRAIYEQKPIEHNIFLNFNLNILQCKNEKCVGENKWSSISINQGWFEWPLFNHVEQSLTKAQCILSYSICFHSFADQLIYQRWCGSKKETTWCVAVPSYRRCSVCKRASAPMISHSYQMHE